MFSPSLRSLLQDIECEDGFTKRKVMMHAGNNFKFQELSDFNEIKCKAAYKVLATECSIFETNGTFPEFC